MTTYKEMLQNTENECLIAEMEQLQKFHNQQEEYHTANIIRVAIIRLKGYMGMQ